MKTRTSKRIITFSHPFVLDSIDKELPAGDYDVETDEELLEGISFLAYRRILTVIHLHPKARCPGETRTIAIEPHELAAALERDRARTASLVKTAEDKSTRRNVRNARRNAVDRQAIDRAEDEGMIVLPK